MKKPIKPRGKQHDARAASFKRIAKALRVRARNHQRAAKALWKGGHKDASNHQQVTAYIYTGLAQDFEHEAGTLSDMR